MTTAIVTATPTLEQFLTLPETKPASEYIEGEIVQKHKPKGKHSQLQLNTIKIVQCYLRSR